MALDVDHQRADREVWRVKAANMQNLTHTPGWDAYFTDLKTLERETTDEMIAGSKDRFEFLQGKIAGLRLAMNQPEIVIKLVKEVY